MEPDKKVEFKLFFIQSSKTGFNVNKMVIDYIYENYEFNFIHLNY
jgi:hypothetical protein